MEGSDSHGEYTEFSLTNSSDQQLDSYHIMKIPAAKFNIDSLKPPVTLTRQKPEIIKDEQQPKKIFQKKTKAIFRSRDEDEDEETNDVDANPWVLKDDLDTTYFGKLEGGQHSNYVLFVSNV